MEKRFAFYNCSPNSFRCMNPCFCPSQPGLYFKAEEHLALRGGFLFFSLARCQPHVNGHCFKTTVMKLRGVFHFSVRPGSHEVNGAD